MPFVTYECIIHTHAQNVSSLIMSAVSAVLQGVDKNACERRSGTSSFNSSSQAAAVPVGTKLF